MPDILLAVVRDRLWAAYGCVGVVVGVIGVLRLRRSGLLLAPVMRLTTGVVAESLIPPALSAFGIRTSERDYPAAILAPGQVTASRHQPVHLQVHCPAQACETPASMDLGRIADYLQGVKSREALFTNPERHQVHGVSESVLHIAPVATLFYPIRFGLNSALCAHPPEFGARTIDKEKLFENRTLGRFFITIQRSLVHSQDSSGPISRPCVVVDGLLRPTVVPALLVSEQPVLVDPAENRVHENRVNIAVPATVVKPGELEKEVGGVLKGMVRVPLIVLVRCVLRGYLEGKVVVSGSLIRFSRFILLAYFP